MEVHPQKNRMDSSNVLVDALASEDHRSRTDSDRPLHECILRQAGRTDLRMKEGRSSWMPILIFVLEKSTCISLLTSDGKAAWRAVLAVTELFAYLQEVGLQERRQGNLSSCYCWYCKSVFSIVNKLPDEDLDATSTACGHLQMFYGARSLRDQSLPIQRQYQSCA